MPALLPVAVAVDGARPPAWQARVLELVDASPHLLLVEIVTSPAVRAGVLWRVHAAIERRLLRITPDALAPADIELSPTSDEAPRLLLWLAEGPPPADREPVLWLEHGADAPSAAQAFARAVAAGDAVVETMALLRESRVLVAARTVSGVRPFSATLSANLALWKCAELVVRAAERRADAAEPVPAGAKPCTVDGAGTRFFVRSLWRWGRLLGIRLLFRRPWGILVRRRRSDHGEWRESGEQLVRWRPGHVYADPCLFEHDGGHHLFCEEVPAGGSCGVISHVELREGVDAGPPQPVIVRPYHLSYPQLLSHRGDVLLVPEASAVRRLELYRAERFPDRWTLEAVLLDDVDIVDATLLEHEGRWWLFANVAAEGASRLDELHVFIAGDPRGPWSPHPRNPVVSDVRGARPAGGIIDCAGRLVRPAQDGSRRYGWAVSMRAIDVLSETEYREHEIARLTPDQVPGARALHTYTRDGLYEAIDVRRRVPRSRLLGVVLRWSQAARRRNRAG